MTQSARNAPTWENDHPSSDRNTGRPTTNQTSREANRNRRAAESQLMAGDLEKSEVNLTFFFDRPRSPGNETTVPSNTTSSAPAMAPSAPTKPRLARSTLPTKKPTPLSAFFEPVSRATHLKQGAVGALRHHDFDGALGAHLGQVLGDPRQRLRRHHVGDRSDSRATAAAKARASAARRSEAPARHRA